MNDAVGRWHDVPATIAQYWGTMMLFRQPGFVVALGLILLLTTSAAVAGIRIASWNVLHLGWNNDKNLVAVAAVAAQFDLIAVQELMEPAALARLDAQLEAYTGVEWDYLASEAEGRTSYQEHYGFLWCTDKVGYAGNAVSYIDEQDMFAREPFSAQFTRLENGQQIVVATVHIRFGDSKSDRRPELEALGRYWRWLGDSYPHADLRVLAGDMNMPPDDPAWDVLDRSARALILRGRSTLSTTAGEYASLYDQIFVPDSWSSEATIAGVFVYPRAYDWGWDVRNYISDHLPVYLILGGDQFTLRDFGKDLDAIMGGSTSAAPTCIRLNQASAERLDELPHVGPSRAQDIIDGRPWDSVQTLVDIRGLGQASIQDIVNSELLCTNGL